MLIIEFILCQQFTEHSKSNRLFRNILSALFHSNRNIKNAAFHLFGFVCARLSTSHHIKSYIYIYIQIKCIHRHSEPKTGQNTIETKQQKKSYATVSLLITRINCLKLETKSIWQFICFLSLFAFFFCKFNRITQSNLVCFVRLFLFCCLFLVLRF